MIGFLRLVGLLNAAIWLGGAVFFSAIASPALTSKAMLSVLQARNFAYFSPAIEQVVLSRYFQFCIVCGLIALLQLGLEWLYLGRPARKLSFGLLLGLLVYGLVGANGLHPHPKQLHSQRHAAATRPAERQAADKSYRLWHAGFQVSQFLVLGALGWHYWRLVHQPAAPRFISSVKFRG